jgi:N-formylglutamate amidohydrolase
VGKSGSSIALAIALALPFLAGLALAFHSGARVSAEKPARPRCGRLFVSAHSGTAFPPGFPLRRDLAPEEVLHDVDLSVDELFQPAARLTESVLLTFPWHKYSVDPIKDPVRQDDKDKHVFRYGVHWATNRHGQPLLNGEISVSLHRAYMKAYFEPFHARVEEEWKRAKSLAPGSCVFVFDLHSMPSEGEHRYRDVGVKRPDVVLAGLKTGTVSAKDLGFLRESFEAEGFSVGVDQPFFHTYLTKKTAAPGKGVQAILVEINRSLYLDEKLMKPKAGEIALLGARLGAVFSRFNRVVEEGTRGR